MINGRLDRAASDSNRVTSRIYVTPRALLWGPNAKVAVEAGSAWPLLGTDRAFAAAEITTVTDNEIATEVLSRHEFESRFPKCLDVDAALEAMKPARAPFAGLDMSRPRIMGIINVTPDSFSDGGAFLDPDKAIAHGLALANAGADILDVGGESTRPGAEPVAVREEIRRVLPIVRELSARGHRVSIDTRHASVMAAAIEAGAMIVNDVTALGGDRESLGVVARSHVAVVLMHMQGDPRSMQKAPRYVWAPGDVFDNLAHRLRACREAGLSDERIAVDPGIGFGKTTAHSLAVLNHLALFHGMGYPVVLGVSRKSVVAALSSGEGVQARIPGSLAAAVLAAANGLQILRVHDVAETKQALAVATAINQGLPERTEN